MGVSRSCDAARAHVRPGGLVACAILGDVEPFELLRWSGRTEHPRARASTGSNTSAARSAVGQSRRTVAI